MTDRTTTPDILGSLMAGKEIRQESNKAKHPLKTDTSKGIKPSSSKSLLKHPASNEPEQLILPSEESIKEKATFNLPVKILYELEDKWMEMRRLSRSKQLSKTLIVEEALKMAFAEFDQKKHVSKFYSELVSNSEIKNR